MKLDKQAEQAVRELGEAINSAIEKSSRVTDAINYLREIGYEPNLLVKLEISLLENKNKIGNFSQETELDLTKEDLKTLQKMGIRFDNE